MRLLVAFDGSAEARAALEVAGRLMRDSRADVVAVHLLNRLTDATGVIAPTTAEALQKARTDALRALAEAFAEAGIDRAMALVEVLTRGEDVAVHLQRVASEHGADIVVVGSRRAGRFGAALAGSVAEAMVRSSPCPVLVVRPRKPPFPRN